MTQETPAALQGLAAFLRAQAVTVAWHQPNARTLRDWAAEVDQISQAATSAAGGATPDGSEGDAFWTTGHAEADRLIGRLLSSDPEFDDCTEAAVLIRKLVLEEIKGPEGYATWKDAAIAERAARAAPDPDGEAFRTAAHLGLTLRFYGGCAQSGMPGSPSAYEVVNSQDRAAAMREAVERAAVVIDNGGEPQQIAAQSPAVPANCVRCSGSGEDPEGFCDQSRGPNGATHDGPCRTCNGTGAAQSPAVPAELSVTNILLKITPGMDGMGHEVYAKSVKDVEDLLSSMGQELEEWQLGMRRVAAQSPDSGAGPADGGTPGPWYVRKLERNGELRGCFVSAPDCQGLAYDAEIMGDDEYRDKDDVEGTGMARRLADCELIVAAVNAHRAARAKQGAQNG